MQENLDNLLHPAGVPPGGSQVSPGALAGDGQSPSIPGSEPDRRITRVRYTHEAMIDLVIANPAISQGELAQVFGYTQAWISNIFNSDAFKMQLARRREQLIDPAIRERAEAGFDALVSLSQAHLLRKLQKTEVSDQLALRALELSSRAKGYGARDPAPAAPSDATAHLAELGNNLVNLLRDKRKSVTLDGEIDDVNSTNASAA